MLQIKLIFDGGKPTNDNTSNINSQLNPLPQQMEIKNPNFIQINPSKIQIEISGTNETHQVLPSLSKTPILINPEWSLEDFGSKITQWLNERLGDLQIPEIKNPSYRIKKDEQLQITNQNIKQIPLDNYQQAYTLTTKLKTEQFIVELTSWTMMGAYYGILTLSQLLHPTGKKSTEFLLPVVKIIDYPQYKIRGLVDDVSRGQRPTMDNFKKFIRFLSRSKQNIYVLYLEDMFKFEKYPQIGVNRAPLTRSDIKELEAYAEEHFVTIVPAFELLGHLDNMLLDPDLMQYGEFPGAQCIDVSSEAAKDFIRDMIAEIAPAFKCTMFAPICDESFDFGAVNGREYVEKKGWGVALADWYIFLVDELEKIGKSLTLFAHDILIHDKEVMSRIKGRNILVYYWKYVPKKNYVGLDILRKNDLKVFGGPAVFDWSRHYPYNSHAEKNMMNLSKDGIEKEMLGLVTTKWGDFFNENFRENIYYGLAVNGQAGWTPQKSNIDQMKQSFVWNFFGKNALTEESKKIIQTMITLDKQNINLPRWPNGMFNRFWYDPFVRKIKKKEYQMAEGFIKDAKTILNQLNSITKNIIKNQGNLDYLSFSARMARHYGVKILISESTYQNNQKFAQKVFDLLPLDEKMKNQKELAGYKWLSEDIQNLAKDYKRLWLQLAVPEGLEYPTEKFTILQRHYDWAIESLEHNEKPHSHQLQSEWIWRSGPRLSATWGNLKELYFVKDFTIDGPKTIENAIIQVIANNQAKIYINENYLGEVLSRFSLSQYPLAKAVQWFDVTDHIIKKNTISVMGANWQYGIGSFNLILHIKYKDGTTEDIISDNTWKWNLQKPTQWPILKENLSGIKEWKYAKSQGKAPGAWMGPITKPLWEQGIKSSISYIFGNYNYTNTAIRVQMGMKVYKYLFWLVKPLARFFSIDMYMLREKD